MNEDLQYKKLKIGVSPDVEKDIQLILDDNDNKVHQIQEWLQYIEDVKNYFSNEKVAWDNANEFEHKQDGSVISKGEMPRIKYSILTDGINPEFVVIEEMDYRLEQYGLRKPSLLGITVTTYESHDRVFISLRDYITEQKYINTTYKMKSLQQYISEQMVCELSSTKLAQAYRKETDRNGYETNRARRFKKGAHQAFDREMNGDSSKHNDNPSTYEIGDLYYEGNKAVGIVVDTKDGGKHATVMSLTSFDENGNHKTTEQILNWKDAINGAKQYGRGWYLPSKEELKAMYKSFDKIQSVLKNTKGALALSDDNYYWSSTEYDSDFGYELETRNGHMGYNIKKGRLYVRAFLQV